MMGWITSLSSSTTPFYPLLQPCSLSDWYKIYNLVQIWNILVFDWSIYLSLAICKDASAHKKINYLLSSTIYFHQLPIIIYYCISYKFYQILFQLETFLLLNILFTESIRWASYRVATKNYFCLCEGVHMGQSSQSQQKFVEKGFLVFLDPLLCVLPEYRSSWK